MARTNKTDSTASSGRKQGSKRTSSGKTPRKSVADGSVSKKKVNTGEIKKPHRWHAGTVALREIRRYQKSSETLLRRTPFIRLVRHLASDMQDDLRFQGSALAALHLALEQELIKNFEGTQSMAVHAKRVTIYPRDLHGARHVRNQLAAPPIGYAPVSGYVTFATRSVTSDAEAEAEAEKNKNAKKQKKTQPKPAKKPEEAEANVPEDDEEANAAADAIVRAVAQEVTLNAAASNPGTPETDAPATPAAPATPSRKARGAKAKEATPAAPAQFDDNDMSMFA